MLTTTAPNSSCRSASVSALFPDIIQCMPIQVLEIKKSASFCCEATETQSFEPAPSLARAVRRHRSVKASDALILLP